MITTATHEFMGGRAVVHFGEWLGERIEYAFYFDEELLFEGSDFRPSPLHESNGRESARALLGFLTLQLGDTDAAYFEKYTARQIQWARSSDCEYLGCCIVDEEQEAQD